VISAADIGATSLAKGESIADMAKVVGSYADIIVIRHPWEGAARVVADYAGIPVINAGDGGHQHPTQTLCDLYTLQKERKRIKGLNIALWGDLKYGRTTHSLIFALAKFGANMLFCPSPGLEVPEHIIDKLTTEYGGDLERFHLEDRNIKDVLFPVDAAYTTPNQPHQLAMIPETGLHEDLQSRVDALYVTRPQKERFTAGEKRQNLKKKYPVVNRELLKDKVFRETLVMHPLPRVDELSVDVDADERSMYFKQAARGVPVRMALLALILGAKEVPVPEVETPISVNYPTYMHDSGLMCPNSRCASIQETETKYLKPEFKIVKLKPFTLRCVYCEHGFEPKFIASSEWHEGRLSTKTYHRSDSRWVKKISPENLIVFNTEEDALSHGFQPDRSVKILRKTVTP
jgi:aspartate carbamoyltransferase catalytic subunit